MQNTTDTLLSESMNPSTLLPNPVPLYSKCLSCPDFVTACRGIDITSLNGSDEKRAYHKAIKKEFGFLLRDIYPLVKNVIGKSTTDEYFGSGTGDYKWLTVTTIHNALLYLVAQKKGMPLCEHSCSSSSSEVRNQLAAADLKVAASELKQAQAESECEDLRRRLADSDGDHTTKLTELAAAKQGEIDWLKTEVRVWRRFACILLIVGLVILGTLMLSLLIHVV
jgi:hypothetical protein